MNPAFRSVATIVGSLDNADLTRLRDILRANTADPTTLSKTLLAPLYVQTVVGRASTDGITALKTWAMEGGAWRDPGHRSRLEQGIQELRASGWVFETVYGPHRRMWLMPWELLPLLLPLLWEIPWREISVPAPPRPETPAPVWGPLVHDLFQVLSFCRHEPLLLTNQRAVYHRQKVRLEKSLWPRPGLAAPMVLDRLLQFMDQMEFFYVEDTPFRYAVSADAIDWLKRDPPAAFQYLAEFLFDPGRMGWPPLAWISLAALLPPDRALLIPQAAQWLKQLGFRTAHNGYLWNQAVGDLCVTDIWDVSDSQTLRLTSFASAALQGRFEPLEATASFAQPTGEIIVPPTVPLYDRWIIDGLTSRGRSERVAVFRVDMEAAKQGVAQGLDAAAHTESLNHRLRSPLPQNVRANLEDWYRQLSRHRILDLMILHSSDEAASQALEAVLGDDFVQRLAVCDIVIRRDRIKDVVKKLGRAGHPLLTEIIRPSDTPVAPPTSPPHRRRYVWPVQVPRDNAPTPPPLGNVRDILIDAVRKEKAVTLRYIDPGATHPRDELVVPVAVEPRWVQVYVVHQRRYVLVDWKQILSAEVEAGPV